MNIYTLFTPNDTMLCRFFLNKKKELELASESELRLSDAKLLLKQIFAHGVIARRASTSKTTDGQRNLSTIFVPIDVSDQFYEEALIEQLWRQGFRVDKHSASDEKNEIANMIQSSPVDASEREHMLKSILFAPDTI